MKKLKKQGEEFLINNEQHRPYRRIKLSADEYTKGTKTQKQMVIGGNKMKMKKMKLTAAFIAALFLAVGCAGSPKAGSGDDGLDAAMRKISDYLNEKIPQRSKVVFLNVKSNWPDLSEYILSGLSENAVNDGVFSVVDRQQLDAIRAELNFQWSGEVSDASAQEIGKMLGAQTIVSGTVTTLGDEYRIQVRAIAVQTAAVQGQTTQTADGKGKRIAALTKKVGPSGSGGASSSTSTAGGGKTQTTTTSGTGGQAAQTAKVKAGTYTFFPRPQATVGGLPVEHWLDKVFVSGNFFIVFIVDAPRGESRHDTTPRWTGHVSGEPTRLDSQNTSKSWKIVRFTGVGYSGNYNFTFENVTGTSFILTSDYEKPPIVLEFDLDKAEYTP
jgi:TolB-like protein